MAAFDQVISSAANPLLKEIRRAIRGGTTTSDGCMVAESFHLFEEALRSGRECGVVLASQSACSRVRETAAAAGRDVSIRVVQDSLFDDIAGTETPQGVIALVRPPSWTLDDLFHSQALVAVLDRVQDPGNAGAIVRAAEAFGATGVVFLDGTASPFNPKTLRASAGSLFRLPYVWGVERDAVRQQLRERNVQVLAASPQKGESPDRLDWTSPTALVIGSEAHGVSMALRQDAKAVRIPTCGVESLNASIAAAVLLYEASRQRALSGTAGDAAPADRHLAGKASP